MNSCEKGKKGEREAAKWWRDHGFPDAARGQQHKGGPDAPDVANVPGIHLEVKRDAQLKRMPEWLAQAMKEAPIGKCPVVMSRVNRGEWMFTLGEEDFLEIYRAWRAMVERYD